MKSQTKQDNSTSAKKRKLQSTLTPVSASESSNQSTTPLRQTGTGLHLDSWPYNLWGKLDRKYKYEKLDRFRPFQSMLCLSDGDSDKSKEEGGLEIIPGFPSISADGYFEACDEKFRDGESMRKKSPWVSPYHVKFVENDKEDEPLFELIRKVKRVPKNWTLQSQIPLQVLFSHEENEESKFEEMFNKHSQVLTKRHLEFFHRYGYVVVEGAVSKDVCNQLLNELGEYSKKAGCSLPVETIIKKQKLAVRPSKEDFRKISGPFGSMIEYFYLPTQQRLRMNEALYCATVKLVANTWCCNLDVSTPFQEGSIPKWKYECPLEKELDPRKLWTYVDRMNFRFPNRLK